MQKLLAIIVLSALLSSLPAPALAQDQTNLQQMASLLSSLQSIFNALKIKVQAFKGGSTIQTAQAQTADITTGLVGHWKFDEGSGTTAADSSGNNNVGTLANGPTWTTGKIGGGVSFDGVDDNVILGNGSSGFNSAGTTHTIAFWINRASTAAGQYYVFDAEGGRIVISMGLNATANNISFYDGSWKSLGAVAAGSWQHVVLVLDAANSSATSYLNGALLGSGAYAPKSLQGRIRIAGPHDGSTSPNLQGVLDDFRIYNRAISASEIQTVYSIGNGTPPPSDTQAPTVSITAPSAGSTVSGSAVTVSANASDNVGVVGVQFKLDGANLGAEDTSSLYSITWNSTTASNGSHTLTATARDAAGNQTTSSGVPITVNNTAPPADTQVPSIPTNLSATAVSSSQINLSWTASTDNVGVTGYRIYRGGTQITTVTGTSYSNTGLSPSTSYSYMVAAYDSAGNVSSQSSSASATTQASGGSNPIDSLQPGHWYQVPNSKIRNVLPSPIPPGGTGPISIVIAWSGGAYDTTRDRYLVTGGGHNDYGGNEIYAFDINTLAWSRVWGPSTNIPGTQGACNEAYSDGNPSSRHTYDGLDYLPNQNSFWINSGSLYCGSGGAGSGTWMFNFVTGQWTRKVDNPFSGQLEMVSAYDPVTGHVFTAGPSLGSNILAEFDPVANTWTGRGNTGVGYRKVAAIDWEKRKYVAIGEGEVWEFNLTPTGTINGSRITTTGDTTILNGSYPGFVYDPVSDKFVAWSGGSAVYTLDITTRVWTRVNATGGAIPTANPSQGTYGRFQYIPSKNAFIVVNSIDEDVYIYKLSSGGGTPPPSDTTAPTVSLTSPASGSTVSGSSVIVSANASDNVGVTGVQFKLNGSSLGSEDTASPYSIPWNTTTSSNGSHTLTATARDAAGNTTTSSGTIVTVNNVVTPPPSTKFILGDRVQVSSGPLNVRSTPSTSGTLLGTQATNNLGTVIGGPTAADGYNWWNINYDNAPDGWSAEDFLEKYTAPGGTLSIPDNTWVARKSPTFPASLGAPSKHVRLIYDSDRHVTYLWGGDYCVSDPSYPGGSRCASHEEFWQYDVVTNAWTLLLSNAQGQQVGYPRGLCLATMQGMYDPIRKVVWMTGGEERYDNYNPNLVSGGLWAFDPALRVWSKESNSPQYGDSPRVNTSEVQYGMYDPVRDQLIVPAQTGRSGPVMLHHPLTGMTLRDGTINDNWSQFGTSLAEPLMGTLPIVYDPSRDVAWFYNTCQGGTPCSQPSKLWKYTISTRTWTLVNTNSIVPNKHVFGMAYDSRNDAIVIFGGYDRDESGSATYINDLWIYNIQANTWTKPTLSGAIPTPRKGENLIYDSYNNVLMFQGGTGGFQTGIDAGGYDGTEVFLLRLNLGSTLPPSDTQAPAVSITAPTSGSTVSGASVIVSANASDNVGVAGVQFKLDGANLGSEDTTSPYSVTWNTTSTSNGSHTLTATARDAAGNQTTSSSVTVTVSNGSGGSSITVNPSSSWCSTINSAVSGTEIIFTPGNYSTTCNITVSGTAAAPIVLRSQDPLNPAVFNYPGSTSNIIEVRGSYLTFRSLSFRPNSDSVDAIRILGGTRNIIVEKSRFEGTANIMLSANSGNTQDLIMRDNTLINLLNTPVYIGTHDGSSSSQNLLFERNYIKEVHPPDPSTGYGIEVKLNSWATIRDNTIYNTKGPPIMVYGSNNGSPASIIEGNYTEGSVNEGGIVVGGGPAIVRNNVAVNNGYGGISVQNYNGRNLIQNIQIVHNTLINNFDSGINLQSWTSPTNVLAYNAILPRSGTSAIRPAPTSGINVGNITCTTACFVNAVTAPYDLWPTTTSQLLNAAGSGSESWRPLDDFMGEVRGTQADVGAFERTSSTANHLVGNNAARPPRVSGTPPSTLVGDLNADRTVNALDWSIMNSQWNTNNSQSDINSDGIVNSIDFSLMNTNWGRSI